jgi:hypothetical protein
MKWLRPKDYHGSRSYIEGPPVSMFSLTQAWFASIAKTKLRYLGGRRLRPPHVLLHDGEHGFSLLGAKIRTGAGVPVKARTWDRRDSRILP